MTRLKPFQVSTVEAALEALTKRKGARRFLVADEVGLGKTVVAQEIIRRMSEDIQPLRVFYVCSNLSIAHQNRDKLIEFLPREEREEAVCSVDRLTLMPSDEEPLCDRLHLYTLTPETSIPMRQGRRRDGRQEERALIHALVENTFPWFFDEYGKQFFRRQAGKKRWKILIKRYRQGVPRIICAFRDSVRKQFQLAQGEWLPKKIRETIEERDELEVIARFRNALAACALGSVQPDLVIFDEFQRFRDLTDLELTADESAAQIIHALRGDNEYGDTALLLLSATPYRLYSTRWEDTESTPHHTEFFDLIEFLFGNSKTAKQQRQECEQAFSRLEHELRSGTPFSDEAAHARKDAEQMLRSVMSRTERLAHADGRNDYKTEEKQENLAPEDLQVYKHFCDSLHPAHRFSAVPYWNSIPYPIQSMGQTYTVWKKSHDLDGATVPQVTQSQRDQFQKPDSWVHPRLRALKSLFPTEILSRPWVAPSLPWWPLSGLWENAEDQPQKALLFSRFRAVPPAVASLLSYDLEASLLAGGTIPYDQITRRRLLQATGERHALLGLFHPSPWLIQAADPLEHTDGRRALDDLLEEMRQKLASKLASVGIKIKQGTTSGPLWILIGQLERKAGNWERCFDEWMRLHQETQRNEDSESGLGRLLRRWQKEAEQDVESITEGELTALAHHVLASPGIVVGRAILRHWPGAFEDGGFRAMLSASWSGLRTYLDQRWFMNALVGDDENRFPAAIQRAILDGNLESVLDEHLWIMSQISSLSEESLVQELTNGLSVRTSIHRYHAVGNSDSTFSLRSHVALPFVDSRQRELDDGTGRPLRTDELRRAFNTPFWPHVLTTTSIGQEGLDFHVWCKTLVHWDLCSNPLDLEQREGRIQRYGGLAIRKALANRLKGDALSAGDGGASPWQRLSAQANKRMADESGLSPWWIFPGADIKRYVLEVPTSEQRFRLAWLKEQRMLYRLVLGQPNQEDLLEVLKREGLDSDALREALLDLSAHDFSIA